MDATNNHSEELGGQSLVEADFQSPIDLTTRTQICGVEAKSAGGTSSGRKFEQGFGINFKPNDSGLQHGGRNSTPPGRSPID